MYRTCNNCKALDVTLKGCQLGYKTEWLQTPKDYEGLYVGSKPLEKCPKPKTNDQYMKLI